MIDRRAEQLARGLCAAFIPRRKPRTSSDRITDYRKLSLRCA